jgi:hypothetical protein
LGDRESSRGLELFFRQQSCACGRSRETCVEKPGLAIQHFFRRRRIASGQEVIAARS